MNWLIKKKRQAALLIVTLSKGLCRQLGYQGRAILRKTEIYIRQLLPFARDPRPAMVGSVVWISQYYKSSNPQRQHEIDYSFSRNIRLPWINEKLISVDKFEALFANVEYTILNTERLTFSHFLQIVDRRALKDSQSPVVILSNSDIELTDDLTDLFPWIHMNDLICLTRHEPTQFIFPIPPEWNQDCWIMRAQPLSSSLINSCNIFLGVPGCDNRFAALMLEAGFTIWNPCINVKTYHHHTSSIRTHNSSERLTGSYCEPYACSIEDLILRKNPGYRLRTVYR